MVTISKILDTVFQLIFARFRRRYGDSQIEFAWRRASYRMAIYTSWTVCALTSILVIGGYTFLKIGTAADHKKVVGIAAGVAVMITAIQLDRRFKKYLASPPPLSPKETPNEARYISYFCVVSVGVLLLVGLILYLLHKDGIVLS